MNTGFLGPAVATVLTACGIETVSTLNLSINFNSLQQYLPLAVLKPQPNILKQLYFPLVATVLTACGIETDKFL